MAILKKNLNEEKTKKYIEENKLNAEDLEAVNGGYLFWIKGDWEVINDKNGEVMDRLVDGFYQDAAARAKALGQSTEEVDWSKVDELRRNAQTGGAKKSHDLS